MIARTIAAATLVAWLGGCASGGAEFNSKTDMAGVAPPKRLFVYLNVKSQAFNDRIDAGFAETTQAQLQACGITVTMMQFDPMSMDMKKAFTDAAVAFHPDAVVMMSRDGGNLTTGNGGVSGQLYFNAKGFSADATKTLWTARINYRTLSSNMYVDDHLSGERFGKQFVSRMAQDGFVSGCPANVVHPET
jgi:hypothetical protein